MNIFCSVTAEGSITSVRSVERGVGMARQTQFRDVLEHLIEYGSITSIEAIQKYGCTRLSARIYEYRALGYEIESDSMTVKNRYGNTATVAVYRLKAAPEVAV